MYGRRTWVALGVIASAALLVYLPTLSSLVRQWASDDNYSHGFIVVPCAVYFAWQKRRALAAQPPAPRLAGLGVVLASLGLFVAGKFGAELFLTRISLVGLVAGVVIYLFGWRQFRLLAFPIGLLVLMVPLPAVVFNQIAFPLQLLASRAGETVLSAAGVPVLREGNLLMLPTTTLEVAQACSGIRSLVSLLTLAVLLGAVAGDSIPRRVALAALSVPVAIVANAARVAGTGLAADWIGPAAAEGFFHEFSGWVMFVIACALLIGLRRLLLAVPGVHVHAPHPTLEAS